MNKMRTVVFLMVIAVALATCSTNASYEPSQTSVAYSLVHGGYLGKAIVTTGSTGLLDVTVDEAFLPHILAHVDMESGEWNDENTVYYVSRGEEQRVAKYVEYAGAVYVGSTVGSGVIYVEADDTGKPVGAVDIERAILRNQATMEAYFDGISAGQFKTISEFGGPAQSITTTTYGGLTKSTSPGYWGFGQTWAGNMAAVETFVEENGAGFALQQMVRGSEDADGLKKWAVADVVTGATFTDFKDYFGLIQAAVGRLEI